MRVTMILLTKAWPFKSLKILQNQETVNAESFCIANLMLTFQKHFSQIKRDLTKGTLQFFPNVAYLILGS